MNIVQNELHLINKYCNHIPVIIIISIHIYSYPEINGCGNTERNPRADSWVCWLMANTKAVQKLLPFLQECSQPYDFCREANKVGQTYCAHIVHPRSTIFGTHNLTMPIINNIKKFFEQF